MVRGLVALVVRLWGKSIYFSFPILNFILLPVESALLLLLFLAPVAAVSFSQDAQLVKRKNALKTSKSTFFIELILECGSINDITITGFLVEHLCPSVVDLFGFDDLYLREHLVIRTIVHHFLCFGHTANK